MPYRDREKQNAWQREYRRRKSEEAGGVRAQRAMEERKRYWRRVENEQYARAAMKAYRERQGVGA